MGQYRQPGPLSKHHDLTRFDCGEPALNLWLEKYARSSHASGSARVYATTLADTDQVVGFYALAAAIIEPNHAVPRVVQGQPSMRHIPAILLARLGVDSQYQGKGIGTSLLRDAMRRCASTADQIGVRALIVHAKNSHGVEWYRRYGFQPSPIAPSHLMLLMKDLRAFLEECS